MGMVKFIVRSKQGQVEAANTDQISAREDVNLRDFESEIRSKRDEENGKSFGETVWKK